MFFISYPPHFSQLRFTQSIVGSKLGFWTPLFLYCRNKPTFQSEEEITRRDERKEDKRKEEKREEERRRKEEKERRREEEKKKKEKVKRIEKLLESLCLIYPF